MLPRKVSKSSGYCRLKQGVDVENCWTKQRKNSSRDVRNLWAAAQYAAEEIPVLLALSVFLSLVTVFIPPLVFWILATHSLTTMQLTMSIAASLGLGLAAQVVGAYVRLQGAERTGRALVAKLSATLAEASRLEDLEDTNVAPSLLAAQSGAAHFPGAFNMALNCLSALCRLASLVLLVVVIQPRAALVLVLFSFLYRMLTTSNTMLAQAQRKHVDRLTHMSSWLETFDRPTPRSAMAGLHLQDHVDKRTGQLADGVVETSRRVVELEQLFGMQRLRSRMGVSMLAAILIALASVALSRDELVALVVIAPMLLGAVSTPGRIFDFFDRVSVPFRSVLHCTQVFRDSDPSGALPRETINKLVSYGYGQNKILERFSLPENLGPLAVLTGPNGSGKSTYCEVIAGLRRNQESHQSRCPADGASNVVFGLQGQDLSGLTVRELFAYVGSFSYDADIWNALDSWNIAYVLHERNMTLDDVVGQDYGLSGGECQTLLNCAVLSRTDVQVSVLDEPFSGLDPGRCQQLAKRLLDRAATMPGSVTLIVAHGDHRDLLDVPTFTLASR